MCMCMWPCVIPDRLVIPASPSLYSCIDYAKIYVISSPFCSHLKSMYINGALITAWDHICDHVLHPVRPTTLWVPTNSRIWHVYKWMNSEGLPCTNHSTPYSLRPYLWLSTGPGRPLLPRALEQTTCADSPVAQISTFGVNCFPEIYGRN